MRLKLFLFLLLLTGCAKPQAPNPPVPAPAVENRAIGIALTEVPTGFSVASSEGDALRLTRSDGAEVTIRRASGNERIPVDATEILCQLGPGRLSQRAGKIQVFTRPVVLSYRYPEGRNERERTEQALAVLGEVVLLR
jgi:hypothetical protein